MIMSLNMFAYWFHTIGDSVLPLEVKHKDLLLGKNMKICKAKQDFDYFPNCKADTSMLEP